MAVRLYRAPWGLLVVLLLIVNCNANPIQKFLGLFKKRDKKVATEDPPQTTAPLDNNDNNKDDKSGEGVQSSEAEAPIDHLFVTTPEGLKIEFIAKPESCTDDQLATKGKQVYFKYVAAINEKGEEGSMIVDKGVNEFMLGGGHTMPGLELGVDGMCVGEQRRLTIPPALGMEGMTLLYEVHLTAVGEGKPPANMWIEIDVNEDHRVDPAEMERWFREVKKIEKVPQGAFSSQDKDGDGVITWAEFDGPKGQSDPSLEPREAAKSEL